MPPASKDDGRNRHIRDFFKPFTIPKSRIPVNDVIEDEIIVAATLAPNHGQHATRKLPYSPKRGGEELKSPQKSQSSLPSTLTTFASQESTPKSTPNNAVAVPPPSGVITSDAARPDSPLSSSQSRVMTAVAIPSPKPKMPEVQTTEPINPTKTSFSSFSSLSSVPMSTQSSSKRIVKHGIQAVTNSDSGSAESSSSEEELPDISSLVPRKKPRLDTPARGAEHTRETPRTVKPSNRQRARLSESSKRVSRGGTPQRQITPPRVVYKHSLLNMAKQKTREEKALAKMRQLEAEFEEIERAHEGEVGDGAAIRARNAALADDSDAAERMKLAMQRTEAGSGEEELFYFKGNREDVIDEAFPTAAIESDAPLWIKRLSDEQWRAQACLTGFLAECVAERGLPRPIREWLVEQLLHEQRQDLCHAYVDVLDACVKPAAGLDDKQYMSLARFYQLHHVASQDSVSENRPPSATKAEVQALEYTVPLLRGSNAQSGDGSIARTIFELMLAAIDVHVHNDASGRCIIEDSIESLLESVEDEDRVFTEVAKSLTPFESSAQIKCRAVAYLPAHSERSQSLRRRLALELICGGPLSHATNSPSNGNNILERLKSASELQISESTDYILLNCLISVLDIAIDTGFHVHDFRAPNAVPSSPSKQKASSIKQSTLDDSSEAEKTFNAQIDAFVSALTLMSSRIKDAGTAHLQRTEAKHAIERLTKRLEYGVRTKPRPRQKTFGGMTGDGQRGFLSGFLKKVEPSTVSFHVEKEDSGSPESEGAGIIEVMSNADAVEGATERATDDER